MTEDFNLSERMTIFFGSLSHKLAAGEQVELLWQPRGENEFLRSECFPNLERASRRAASLGPACDVYLQAATEPGTVPWETENTQLLAYWHNRPRRSGDPRSALYAGVAEMRPLRGAEPSWAFIQCYPDGDSTCVATWFYYRSRCPLRGSLRRRYARRSRSGSRGERDERLREAARASGPSAARQPLHGPNALRACPRRPLPLPGP